MFNDFKNLFKKKVETNALSKLGRVDSVDQFFERSLNLFSPNELVRKIGGVANFYLLSLDEDIYQGIDKRIAALLDTRLVFEGENKALVEFFNENILPFEDQLKQDFWWTQFNGYGVEQIVYRDNGEIEGFIREEFWRFQPLKDLIHARLIHTDNSDLRNQVVPYGKYVLTTNGGTHSKPTGMPIAERLIAPWFMKCNSDDLWMDFAKRFANGFMHAKIEDSGMASSIYEMLSRSVKSGLYVTDKNTDLEVIQPNRDSSLYESMSSMGTKRITKVLLGETQTSEMEARGSSASASIHNEVRLEKTRADIKLVERGINEIILQVALVNGFIPDASYESMLPKAKVIYDPSFNLELAQRDATLSGAGVQFTKKYFIENYGFDENDFEIVEKQESSFPFSDKSKKRTFLSKNDVENYLGNCGDHVHLKSAGQIRNEVDDIVELLDRNTDAPINVEMILSAINTSENRESLNAKLLALFDTRDNSFVDTFTEASYLAHVKGAINSNPRPLDE